MLTIRHGGHSQDGALPAYMSFTVHDAADQLVGRVTVFLDMVASEVLKTRMEVADHDRQRVVHEALSRYAVPRLQAELADPQSRDAFLSNPDSQWNLDRDDLDELLRLVTTKRCDYQIAESRDLYCTAAAYGDPMIVDKLGPRSVAVTSREICNDCRLADATVLCSHLLHPTIMGTMRLNGSPPTRDIDGALCNKGRAEIERPAACHAGWHACWERVVRDDSPIPAEPPPLALPDALDAFDTAWRLAMGTRRRLLTLRSLTTAVGIEQPVVDRESFRNRVDNLADVISTLNVDDDLLPDGFSEQGSLNRLAAAIAKRQGDPAHSEVLVAPLRAVTGLRKALTHSGAASGAPRHAVAMGFDWPPADWHDAWTRVRVTVINSLREIRHALNAIEQD